MPQRIHEFPEVIGKTVAKVSVVNESDWHNISVKFTDNTAKGINEEWACAINQKYRDMRATSSFPRTVDVEMAIFGLSMMAWPFR